MKKGYIFLFALLFPLSLMSFSQWTDSISIRKAPYPDIVFVAPGDTIFHKDACKLLAGGKTAMSPELAQEKGYKPCPECFPAPVTTKYEWSFSLQEPAKSTGLQYSDSAVDISFLIDKTQIGFIIQNKTAGGIKINWDEISFISPTGRASRVIHSGIKLVDRNSPQAPTVIPPNSRISDIAIPSENIYYANEWIEGRLFEGDYLSYDRKEFGLYFPLEIKGVKKEYSFKFKINVTKVSSENK